MSGLKVQTISVILLFAAGWATTASAACPVPVFGDFDCDSDVDLDDLQQMLGCSSGPAMPAPPTPTCQSADADADADVDAADFGVFQRCFSGANQPGDPLCASTSAYISAGRLRIVGTAAGELLALRLQSGNATILQIDIGDDGSADFSFDRSFFTHIDVDAGGGDDSVRIDETQGVFTDIEITTIDGGPGNDTLRGGTGAETFIGGPGNDLLEPNRGNDIALMGAGDDVFQWDPGDGNDTVEGQAGADRLAFNASNATESFYLYVNGSRLGLFRDVGNVTMDVDDVERIDVRALGGADVFLVDNLPGTGVEQVNLDLSGLTGNVGDTQSDAIIVNATNGPDNVAVDGAGTSATVTGLAATVTVTFAEPNDRLTVNSFDGEDALDASALDAGIISLTLNGGAGDDNLVGSAGNDAINGQEDNDTIVGGDGDDVLNLGLGNDRSIWNPGDDTDFVEGEGGVDTVEVNGGNGDETFTTTANGTRVRFDRLNPAPFSLDIGTCENLVLNANGGNDSASCTGNLAALIKITIDGGPGDDTILGSNGIDLLLGGDNNDFIDGQQGNDVAFLGGGDDVFQWDPGDGSDTVEGQAGADRLSFNGSGGNEILTLSANGGRLLFTRDLGNIVMDLDDVERIDLQTLGGIDTVTLNSLAGTDVSQVNASLAGFGGNVGDGAADTVIVNGTSGNDTVTVLGTGTTASVSGLSAALNVTLSEAATDRLTVNGLDGNDTITAASLPAGVIGLTLDGGIGEDTLIGSGGPDTLLGGNDKDTIRGGDGDDIALMGMGDDRFVWNPGDDTDLVEGEDGVDTVEVNGGNGDETFATTANGTRVRFDRLDPAPFSLDIGTCENLILNANGGNDSASCTGNLAALIKITIDGGTGDDTILGSNGADLLLGGDNNDFIDGQQGNDVAFLGAGDDVFQWDPGDGSDTVEGQAGLDRMDFNGSNGAEVMEFSPNGSRLRFTRNLGNIVMDLDDVETVNVQALGGIDTVILNSLVGTDINYARISLSGVFGGNTGDSAADSIVVNGTNGPDIVTLLADGTSVLLSGLSVDLEITAPEPANDRLTFNALGGNDSLDCTGNLAGLIQLTADGGDGDDELSGTNGADLLLGGGDHDFIDGQQGNDVVFLGAGNDEFRWDPGDGSDTIEGQDGLDTLTFNGSSGNEIVTLSPNGSRLQLTRNIGNVVMDVGELEQVTYNALGGSDSAVVNSLVGTSVTQVNVHLAWALGGNAGDAAADNITVNGTAGNDTIAITAVGGAVQVGGLSGLVRITTPEVAHDRLTVNGLAGIDSISTGAGVTSLIAVTANP